MCEMTLWHDSSGNAEMGLETVQDQPEGGYRPT